MKKLLITTDEHGLIIKPDEGKKASAAEFAKSADFERRWDPITWYYYTRNNMKFSVESGQEIQLRLDPKTMLKHYQFTKFKRPKFHKYPHWTESPISIDDARDINANFTGIKAAESFESLKVKPKLLKFKYIGPDAKKSNSGKIGHMHYFAYDLFLKIPNTQKPLWIGPVIRNNGGIGGEP